jgi:hypothetical protein
VKRRWGTINIDAMIRFVFVRRSSAPPSPFLLSETIAVATPQAARM